MKESHWGFKRAGLAAQRVLSGDKDGAGWVFHRSMDDADRKAFDDALVSINHPLALEAGTCEGRFRAYVAELVNIINPTAGTQAGR